MNIGGISRSDEQRNIPRRRSQLPDYSGGIANFQSDLARLALLMVILVAVVGGVLYTRYTNRPERVVVRSVEQALDQPFNASIEGETTLHGATIVTFREREQYLPGEGITSLFDASTGSLPFFSDEALHFLLATEHSEETVREDMFGHGTRHFRGTFPGAAGDESSPHEYDYWIDLRTLLPVRLSLTWAKPDAAHDEQGNPYASNTYLTIRYYGWD